MIWTSEYGYTVDPCSHPEIERNVKAAALVMAFVVGGGLLALVYGGLKIAGAL